MEVSIADAPDNEDKKAIVDGPSEKASVADAATLDDADDGDQPPEGKLAPAVSTTMTTHTTRPMKATALPLRAEANHKHQS